MKELIILFCLILQIKLIYAQQTTVIRGLEKEYWYSGIVTDGSILPINPDSTAYSRSYKNNNYGNQVSPILISTEGRYIWSEKPFEFSISNGTIKIINFSEDSIFFSEKNKNLKSAYLELSNTFFPPSKKIPDTTLFTSPQYNTWIELIYNQNQEDILKYARAIKSNNFPPGVLMIDDNWQEDYGKWNFHPGRFPNPRGMIDELHAMGFKVMLWVCPFVSPDCDIYRDAKDKRLFLMAGDSLKTKWVQAKNPAIINWWNGSSAELDFSNPESVKWFKNQLKSLQQQYGIDGFKLDAGDTEFYVGNSEACSTGIIAYNNSYTPNDHTEAFAKIGLDFPLNEYRATWKMGGQPLAQRLRDKAHNWEDLQKLIPDITLQGILGYPFTCPDMIGGGEYSWFLPGKQFDSELIVRSAQCHVFMPMMQFSVAPWRVLNSKHLDAIKQAVTLRMKFTPYIIKTAKESAISGEPIVRNLEYVFPHQGLHLIKDQFMLGNDLLIAPILSKGVSKRKVVLPKGKWLTPDGKVIKGGKTFEVDISLNSIPYFQRIYK